MIRVVLLALLLVSFSVEADADEIKLTNGDRVSGKVVKSDGKSIVLNSDLLGELTIALDKIASITSQQPVYVGLADGRTVTGVLTTQADKVEIRSTGGDVAANRSAIVFIRSEAEQLAYEKSLNPGWFEQWTGGANLGLALTRGNADITNLATGMAISRETRRDKTSIYAASIYNRDNTDGVLRSVANTIRFGVRYDHDINRDWFGYGFTDLEHSSKQDLNLRWVLGGGIGYNAIRNERTKLDILGGLAMNKEYFEGFDNGRTSLEAQVGQTLSYQLNSRVSLKEQLLIFPNLSDGGEYRINFDTSLVTDITKRIGWQLTLSDRYLSNPPSGLKQNDLLLSTGVRVKLGTLK